MGKDPKRIVEVRLITIVLVDLTEPSLAEALGALARPSSIADAVSSEIVSNLESVPLCRIRDCQSTMNPKEDHAS